MYDFRIVVQPGRTLRSGRRGRWFESSQSDHKKKPPLNCPPEFGQVKKSRGYQEELSKWHRRSAGVILFKPH